MRQAKALGGIVIGGAVVLLASQPVWAATTQVTGVQLDKSENELKLILKTESGDERPAVFTSSQGNDAVTDIVNTQLNLSEGKTFRQENPMPGITSVLVSQLDGNSVRVTVSGENRPPAGQILQQDNQEISLSFSTAVGNQTASPIPGAQAATPILPTPATTPSAQTPTPTAAPTTQSQAQSTQVLPNLNAMPVAQAAVPQGQPSQRAGSATTTVAQNQAPPTIVPAPPAVVPAPRQPEVLVPNPRITIQGAPAQPAGAAQPIAPAPPFLPRAVAPPVGDIAVSNIDGSASTIDLGTGVRVPRLVLREAPVREVLALLARAAGLNLAFIGEAPGEGNAQGGGQGGNQGAQQTISLDLENEPVQDAFNYVLRISGFQANRTGRTIFVGPRLPDPARNIIVRTLRLNQIQAQPAASFLISQGAEQQQITEQTTLTVIGEGAAAQRIENTTTTVEQITPQIEQGGQGGLPGPGAPLLLRGLGVTPDDRLNIVTLIGEPRLVEIATALLTQLDLRRRQVAVNVKVVDVDLNATDNVNTSFSFGIGDSFFGVTNGALNINLNGGSPFGQTDRFLANLQASIVADNAKILTDPTIVVQEGETATINLTEEVVGNIESETQTTEGVTTRTVTAEIREAGLELEINVNKIDDNGFVSLVVNPRVTTIGGQQDLSIDNDTNRIRLLNVRELTSGQVRLRDGQTLILSGIIQETDRTLITKVPILGDIPILGALFRNTERLNQRQEVIVLLTPQILDDSEASSFGYNYTPGRETREVLNNRGFSPQGQ
ncbi:MAG: AMIN domain-containing protein [Symplocastrum torsivum CPER-KK1]|uniref:AMIN domain-containing protein n=1 Tax=Symplocastrum torsivum CPER-KK1 TaxID=450513 RepID=A0A951PSB6_9CYAN|nr:AMIN domain-containing protein [Symplocastrum torsivum CPER-KK1]